MIRSLKWPIGIAATLVVASLVASRFGHLRVNLTASMPEGLWRVRPVTALHRGEIVYVCPPNSPIIRTALHRGYLGRGDCPSGSMPLLKRLAALPGDVVNVTPGGMIVNGKALPGTAPIWVDSMGRALKPLLGTHIVAKGNVWLYSNYDARSFDSRYVGAVPLSNVKGVAVPVWTRK